MTQQRTERQVKKCWGTFSWVVPKMGRRPALGAKHYFEFLNLFVEITDIFFGSLFNSVCSQWKYRSTWLPFFSFFYCYQILKKQNFSFTFLKTLLTTGIVKSGQIRERKRAETGQLKNSDHGLCIFFPHREKSSTHWVAPGFSNH